MKTSDLTPPGSNALDRVRGRKGKRAGTAGPRFLDAQGNDVVAPDMRLIGATLSGEDGEEAVYTINGTGQQTTNDSGADLNYGDVVVQQADGSVTTTTTAQDTQPIGVVQIGGADGDPVHVVFQGYVAQINTTASVTSGNYAETSTTAGKATENATIRVGSFARFLGTGSNPPAQLFGATSQTSGSTGTGGTLGWFNVKDYGALGDGTTDDTAAINLAIAALIAAGSGVLYFPAGTYKVSAALTTITVPCTVLGDGKAGFDGLSGVSQINCTSATAALFTFTPTEGEAMAVVGMGLANTAATDPSAGGAIVVTTSDGLGRVDLDSVSIHRFYDNLDIQGVAHSVRNSYFIHWGRYAGRVRNVNLPDGGDWSWSDNAFFAGAYDSAAAIRVESSGGGKLVNNKINEDGINGGGFRALHGIDLSVAASVSTSVLLIANNSIENIDGDGVHGTTSAGTSKYGHVQIVNNQFGLFSNTTGKAISLVGTTAGDFYDCVIVGNTFKTGATARSAVQLTKCDNVWIDANTLQVFNAVYTATTCTNIRPNATAMPTTPITGEHIYRSDGSLHYTYDGTQWVCTCAHYLSMPLGDADFLPLSATQNGSHRAGIPPAGATIRVYKFTAAFFVSGGTALSGSHKWVIVLKSAVSGTTIATITIDSGTSSVWRFISATVGTNVATNEFEFEVNCTKTGTPGNLYVTPTIDWRIVGT